jgi:hypothetical protein
MPSIDIVPPDRDDERWAVWINTEEMTMDGTILGVGKTRDIAIEEAIRELTDGIVALGREWQTKRPGADQAISVRVPFVTRRIQTEEDPA